ncbi:hypothetical protein C9374_004750 [Naegleria lovaniensis]|uniref:Uncharacterized protein n=1 Tax=Naegleria lovaniensis TaxID=51637 RepID=A0AA88GRF5_NAELO|nr:uncharacterized protein C9374_004750 [Naegleria lovaniensis]KAG2382783.1 hypothetical protein C9374_004750 [Naegleria lovaniensis]
MKQQVDKSTKEFENLDSMTIFDIVQTKINSLDVVGKDFNKMVSQFSYKSVKQLRGMKWMNYEKQLNELKQQVDQFGKLDPSFLSPSSIEEISNEWLYDDTQVEFSTQNTVVTLIKNTEMFGRCFAFNNTKMETGIFNGKLKLNIWPIRFVLE